MRVVLHYDLLRFSPCSGDLGLYASPIMIDSIPSSADGGVVNKIHSIIPAVPLPNTRDVHSFSGEEATALEGQIRTSQPVHVHKLHLVLLILSTKDRVDFMLANNDCFCSYVCGQRGSSQRMVQDFTSQPNQFHNSGSFISCKPQISANTHFYHVFPRFIRWNVVKCLSPLESARLDLHLDFSQ